MSESILAVAVMETIRNVVSPQNSSSRWIDVRPTGQPQSTVVCDVFTSIHPEGWEFTPLNNAICEEYWIHATVSVKQSANHKDFWGQAVNVATYEQSLSYAIRSIIGAIHLQPSVINLANSKLDLRVSSPFCEMLQALGKVDGIEERGPEWWGTSTVARSTKVSTVVGFSQTVKFYGGKRIQAVGAYK